MGSADLAGVTASSGLGGARSSGSVVLGHVGLEHLGVGSWWGLPAGVALAAVEVVRQVLGVAVANLPVLGEAGLVLYVEDGGHVSGWSGC